MTNLILIVAIAVVGYLVGRWNPSPNLNPGSTLAKLRRRAPRLTRRGRLERAEAEADRLLWALDPDFAREMTDSFQGALYLDKLTLARDVVVTIQDVVKRVEVAGSIRRGVADPGDVDLVVEPDDDELLFGRVLKIADPGTLRRSGDYVTFEVAGVKVDLALTSPEFWGMKMLQLTGSREFNALWRRRAEEAGYEVYYERIAKVRRWGYTHDVTEVVRDKSEEEILALVGLDRYADPRSRTYDVEELLSDKVRRRNRSETTP